MDLEYLDIFYNHRMDLKTSPEETMGTLASAVQSEKVLYVGCPIMTVSISKQAAEILNELKVPFVINQNCYSIFERMIENNLVGLISFLCCRKRFPGARFQSSVVTYLPGNRGGLSLGIFIFFSVHNKDGSKNLCAHEYGHTIQCLFLGPLYWLVVAIPSVIWCYCFANYRRKHGVSYEAFYCEHWATAWGKKWSAA